MNRHLWRVVGARAQPGRAPDSLGAHYTPRAYVERLVLPTVIEPLRRDWENVRAVALLLGNEDQPADAGGPCCTNFTIAQPYHRA